MRPAARTPKRQVLADLKPKTGDDTLDNLLTEARIKYMSRDAGDRQTALEKLWDGFERLKTLEPAHNKKASIALLLDRFNPTEWRAVLNTEMNALTDLGNQFQIRHLEHGKTPLVSGSADYLFARMGALIIYLLRHTGRLA